MNTNYTTIQLLRSFLIEKKIHYLFFFTKSFTGCHTQTTPILKTMNITKCFTGCHTETTTIQKRMNFTKCFTGCHTQTTPIQKTMNITKCFTGCHTETTTIQKRMNFTKYFTGCHTQTTPIQKRMNFTKYFTGCQTETTPIQKKMNLTKTESKALDMLSNDTDIIIKEVDKGEAIVSVDSEYYHDKMLEQLNNKTNCKEILSSTVKDIIILINIRIQRETHRERKRLYNEFRRYNIHLLQYASKQQHAKCVAIDRLSDLKFIP